MIKIRMYIFKKQSKGMLPTQSSMTMNCNLKFQIKKEKKKSNHNQSNLEMIIYKYLMSFTSVTKDKRPQNLDYLTFQSNGTTTTCC